MAQEKVEEISQLATLFVEARRAWQDIYAKTEKHHNLLNVIAVRNVCSMVKASKGINEIFLDMLEQILNICLELVQQFEEKETQTNGIASNDEEEIDQRMEDMEADENESSVSSESDATDPKPNGNIHHIKDSSEESNTSDTDGESEREEIDEPNDTPNVESINTLSQDSVEAAMENNFEIETHGEEREITQIQATESTEEIETGEVHSDVENDNDQIAHQQTQKVQEFVNGHENGDENDKEEKNGVDQDDQHMEDVEADENESTVGSKSDATDPKPNGNHHAKDSSAEGDNSGTGSESDREEINEQNETPNVESMNTLSLDSAEAVIENNVEIEMDGEAREITQVQATEHTEEIEKGEVHSGMENDNDQIAHQQTQKVQEVVNGHENDKGSDENDVIEEAESEETNEPSDQAQNLSNGDSSLMQEDATHESHEAVIKSILGSGDFDEGKENDGSSANVYINPVSKSNVKQFIECMITPLETPQESVSDVIMEELPTNSHAEASSSGQSTPSPSSVLKTPMQKLTEIEKTNEDLLQSTKKLSVRLHKIDPTEYMSQLSSSTSKTPRKRGRPPKHTPKTRKISPKIRTSSESSDDFSESRPKDFGKSPSSLTSSKRSSVSKVDGIKMAKKRRLSVNDNQLSSQPIPNNYSTPSTSTDKRSERERAGMKRRRSALRKTFHDSEDLKNLNDPPSDSREELKNNNRNIYYSNSLYEKLCVLCNGNYRFLVTHYAKEHPDREVFVSRPSPEMVDLIKQQNLNEFTFDESSKKITGMCYFCEEEKSFPKLTWQRHLLTHTGEQLFFCDECKTESGKKGMHSDCDSMYVNIYEMDDNDGNDTTNEEPATKKDYPLRCYICNHCNYTQINDISLKNHLRTEHELENDDLSTEYKSYVLVPNLKE